MRGASSSPEGRDMAISNLMSAWHSGRARVIKTILIAITLQADFVHLGSFSQIVENIDFSQIIVIQKSKRLHDNSLIH